MEIKKKLLLMVIDGSTIDIIKNFKEKKRSIFYKFLTEGSSGILKSTIPSQTLPAVPCLYTGKNPAKLGIFAHTDEIGNVINSNHLKSKTLWEILGEHGLSSCIFSAPVTFPPKKINGILVSDLNLPENAAFTYPKELQKEYDFPVGLNETENAKSMKNEDFIIHMKEKTKKKIDIFKDIIKNDDFDFCMYYLIETDTIQHFVWHRKDLLSEYYDLIDGFLREMLERFENILIVSDHGFDDAPTHNFYINSWLEKERYLFMGKIKMINSIIKKIYKLSEFVPDKILVKVRNLLRKNNPDPRKLIPGVDWNRTIAYVDKNYGIWIEKDRCNSEGNSYETVREDIIIKLLNLEFENNKVIKNAYKREEIYNGEFIENVPDILILPEKRFSVMIQLDSGILRKKTKAEAYKGSHDSARDGIILTLGNAFKKQERINADITDITPTILSLYGIGKDKEMDGNVIKSILKGKIKTEQYKENRLLSSAIKNIKF